MTFSPMDWKRGLLLKNSSQGRLIVAIVRSTLYALLVVLGIGLSQQAAAIDLTGHWSGDWLSCSSGHKGPLRADFCKISERCYEVRFKGRFFKIFPFRYAVQLEVIEETPDHVVLSGSQNLGRLFGTFTYSATVTGNCFVATYTSCKDDGQFRMERCTQPCPQTCVQPCETECCKSP
jgi:hypothetical protein